MTDLDKIGAILDWQMKAIIEAALTQDLTGKKIKITKELVKKHKGAARQAIADLLVEARYKQALNDLEAMQDGDSDYDWVLDNQRSEVARLKKGIK